MSAWSEALLKGGAMPKLHGPRGLPPLHRAAERGDVDIVEMLLRRNARTGRRRGRARRR